MDVTLCDTSRDIIPAMKFVRTTVNAIVLSSHVMIDGSPLLIIRPET